jgi:type II secretory pathway pseudopilin PulG
VLAVIAILASLLIPKIFNAINDAKVNNTILGYNTIKTAAMEHYAKYNSFTASTNGTTVTETNFVNQLLWEGLIDKPFFSKIGTSAFAHVVDGPAAAGPASETTAGSYDLDGNTSADTVGTKVVEVRVTGVPYGDAKDVNDRIDGATSPFDFPLATTSTGDTAGRVKWDRTSGMLSIYIGHR